MPSLIRPCALALSLGLFLSCSVSSVSTAQLWSDVPEMAQYVELFNAEHKGFRIEAVYREELAKALAGTKSKPALAVGRRLKASSLRFSFQSLDRLFTDLRLSQASFYPDLLSLGKQEGRQVFLPVSFNMPLICFLQENRELVKTGFFLSPEELRSLGKAFNRKKGQNFTHMGFSPRWDPNFLYIYASMQGSAFHEGKPLAWNESNLQKSVVSIREWVVEANESAASEDEFQFKYLLNPGLRMVAEGRILFDYENSGEYFLLPEDKRSNLDFRWLSRDGKIPVDEDLPYLALCRGARGGRAAEAFIAWFFKEDTQRRILEQAKTFRTMEISFGIAGGFSSLKQVNEKVFPAFYPALVGHLPPAESLGSPLVLPRNWPILKREVILPLLTEYSAQAPAYPVPTSQDLQRRILEWLKENPES